MNIHDIWIIDKYNWKDVNNSIIGLKLPDNSGFWLEVVKNNDKLLITGSYIQPVIAIYQSSDYWAISPSIYLLEKYLFNKGIKLSHNSKSYLNNIHINKETSYLLSGYDLEDTMWNEISIKNNFSNIEIQNDNLTFIPLENTIGTKEYIDTKNLIDEYFKNYKNMIAEIHKKHPISVALSGGTDSRALIPLWKDLDVKMIVTRTSKFSKNSMKYDTYDIDLVNKILDKMGLLYKLNPNIPSRMLLPDYPRDSIFKYGNWVISEKFTNSMQIEPYKINDIGIDYRLNGSATEAFKTCRNRDEQINFVLGTVRRYMIPLFLTKVYFDNMYLLTPFLTKIFLELKPCGLKMHSDIFNSKLSYLDGIPFITGHNEGLFKLNKDGEKILISSAEIMKVVD